MRKTPISLIIIFLNFITSCISYKEVRVNELKSIKPLSLTFTNVQILVELEIENPNGYNIVLKSQDIQTMINGKDIGLIQIKEPIKLPRKSVAIYQYTLIPDAQKIVGVMPSVFMKGTAEISMIGNIKVKAGVIPKKINIDWKKKIAMSDFQL
ncbi:MAG: hypothetical protein EAZ07_09855 [Cytophagales bacterium]|nr:MAG: hypothetical protein EAZ07_09855 [Cytophagales bacterium]